MDPLLVYAASDLDTGGKALERDLPPAWIAEHLADVGASATVPGRVEGRLSRSGLDDVVVRAAVRADVTVPCARCLGPAPIDLRGEISLLLRPGKALPPPARTVKAEDAAGAVASNGNGKKKKSGEGPGGKAIEAARLARSGKAAAATKPDRRVKAAAQGATGKLPEYEFSSGEAEYDLYDGESVVLDDFVREALLLELPNFPLCSEDCPGIAPVPVEAGSAPGEAGGEGRSAPQAGAGEPGGRPRLSELAEAERAPGTKSLGDVLRAALAERDAKGKAKKR